MPAMHSESGHILAAQDSKLLDSRASVLTAGVAVEDPVPRHPVTAAGKRGQQQATETPMPSLTDGGLSTSSHDSSHPSFESQGPEAAAEAPLPQRAGPRSDRRARAGTGNSAIQMPQVTTHGRPSGVHSHAVQQSQAGHATTHGETRPGAVGVPAAEPGSSASGGGVEHEDAAGGGSSQLWPASKAKAPEVPAFTASLLQAIGLDLPAGASARGMRAAELSTPEDVRTPGQAGGMEDQLALIAHPRDAATVHESEWVPAIAASIQYRRVGQVQHDYTLDARTELGHGSFGVVRFAVKSTSTGPVQPGMRVAIKSAKPATRQSEHLTPSQVEAAVAKDRRRFLWEAAMMARVRGHTNVVQLLEVLEDSDGGLHIVMEFLAGGDLMRFVTQVERFSEHVVVYLVRQMLSAVQHVHTCGVVHRDIKPENWIFQSQEGAAVLKLADFGLAAAVASSDGVLSDACGSAFFLAPETLCKKGHSAEADLWSIGVCLYLLLSGRVPFGRHAKKPSEVYRSIRHDPLPWGHPWELVSSHARELVSSLLQKDPALRITAAQALAHPWVSGEVPATAAAMPAYVAEGFHRFMLGGAVRRHLLHKVAVRLQSVTMSELRLAFFSADRNGDGKVSQDELETALSNAGFIVSTRDAAIFMEMADRDGDGMLDVGEFLAAAAGAKLQEQHSAMWSAFCTVDADHNGQLSREELAAILKNIQGQPPAQELVDQCLQLWDTNADGVLTYDEFVNLVHNSDTPRTESRASIGGREERSHSLRYSLGRSQADPTVQASGETPAALH